MPLRSKKIRIILDTNLWISFLISREHEKLDLLFSGEKAFVLFSDYRKHTNHKGSRFF